MLCLFSLCCMIVLFHDAAAFSTAKPTAFQKHTLESSFRHRHMRLGGLAQLDNSEIIDSNTRQYLATCIPGLSNVLAEELQELGASSVETSGTAAVTFEGNVELGLRALLWVRTAHRILEFVAQGSSVKTRDDLYQEVRSSVNVKDLLGDGKGGLLTLSVKAILNSQLPKDISHSHYTALTVKNALCDEIRDLRGDRPNVDRDDADVPLVCILRGNNGGETADVSLWRSLHSSSSLHKRGYRRGAVIHKAAMKESLAAGLLLMTDWKNMMEEEVTLVDPMCGSGSLLLEAAMMAADIAPGLMRIKCGMGQAQPVLKWKQQENASALWKELLLDATERAKTGLQNLRENGNIRILGNDIHDGALDILEQSLRNAGLSAVVQIQQKDCRDFQLKQQEGEDSNNNVMVVTNPPWGVRLSDEDHESWEALRVFLRENCPHDTQAWVLSGNKGATKHLGLKRSQSVVVRTANQDLRWIQYVIRDRPVAESGGEVSASRRQQETPVSPPRTSYGSYRPNTSTSQRQERPSHSRTNGSYYGDSSRPKTYRPIEKKPRRSHQAVPKAVTKTNEQIQQEEKEDSWY